MFGYVVANKAALLPAEDARYRAVYCGLCEELSGSRNANKSHGGALCRLTLKYDMAFLVLLLDSLYEIGQTVREARCIMHPLKSVKREKSEFTRYAADMNIALAYHKLMDDYRDEKMLDALAFARLIKGRYEDIAALWPRQCEAIERGTKELGALEKAGCDNLDLTANTFGSIMAEVLSPYEDAFYGRLCETGRRLGRFIYIMDAWDDCPGDARRGKFKPLKSRLGSGDFDAECKELLTQLMGECANEFEKLPLENDISLLRNIIYSGVWTKYNIKTAAKAARVSKNPGIVKGRSP